MHITVLLHLPTRGPCIMNLLSARCQKLQLFIFRSTCNRWRQMYFIDVWFAKRIYNCWVRKKRLTYPEFGIVIASKMVSLIDFRILPFSKKKIITYRTAAATNRWAVRIWRRRAPKLCCRRWGSTTSRPRTLSWRRSCRHLASRIYSLTLPTAGHSWRH